MQSIPRDELDTSLLPYKELRNVLGVYFCPTVLEHQSWQEIADEIAHYYTVQCIDRIIRQIDALLTNPAIDDSRLTTWVQRSAVNWAPLCSEEARVHLLSLQSQLKIASRRQKRAMSLSTFTSTSFA